MDKRSKRVQSIKLNPSFCPLDIHKSMFINDLMITLPKYYVESWWKSVIDLHNTKNYSWDIDVVYQSPKALERVETIFWMNLSLSFPKNRSKESCYRLKWKKDFAIQLAKDYPKSFVRSLEYHIWDEHYKEKWFTEYDIGGFKEQLQFKIQWKKNIPSITIKEFFRVRDESQWFPEVFKQLSSYLISDYLLSSEDELLRRIQVWNWKPRKEMSKELGENNIYILLNRETKEVYFWETMKSLSKRYPLGQKHHSFDEWTEYCIIRLPDNTSNHTRLLIERILIATGSKLFTNILNNDDEPIFDEGFTLRNKKK